MSIAIDRPDQDHARRNGAQDYHGPNLLCMPQPLEVFCLPARGIFLCESVPTECSISQHRSDTVAKKAKKKKAKKKK
jgi:hypothetical protein